MWYRTVWEGRVGARYLDWHVANTIHLMHHVDFGHVDLSYAHCSNNTLNNRGHAFRHFPQELWPTEKLNHRKQKKQNTGNREKQKTGNRENQNAGNRENQTTGNREDQPVADLNSNKIKTMCFLTVCLDLLEIEGWVHAGLFQHPKTQILNLTYLFQKSANKLSGRSKKMQSAKPDPYR